MLNFNIEPYYDDFDPSKNYHRILFKPGYAVQARELTQAQTILQDQISKFANHIFSQNTPVIGGKITTNLNCYYLKLNSTYNDAAISAGDFENRIIQDTTGTILAKVIATAEATGTETIAGDPPTLIVTYLSGEKFTDGMVLATSDASNLFATTIGSAGGTTSTGLASVASISDGVFYIINGYSYSSVQNQDGSYSKYSIGHFVSVQPQTIILDKYGNTPSYRVGLQIDETVADYVSDTSLLDPALGASNYQAPGADRYQITLTLITLPLTLGNDDAFIELLKISNGSIIKQLDTTVYSVIDDYFAKRDYESNGDYVVQDFKLTPTANTTNEDNYDLKISKGIAYVRGYRLENQSDIVLTSPRARTTESIENNSLFVDYSNYFYVDTVRNTFDVTDFPFVDLHCVPYADVNTANTTIYSSTLVGRGHIRNLNYDSSTSDSNTDTYVYKTYVTDITANTLSSNATASSTTSTIAFYNSTPAKFSGVANAYYGATITIVSGTGIGESRKIVSYSGSAKTANVDTPWTVSPDGTSQFIIQMGNHLVESIIQRDNSYTIEAKANINTTKGKASGISTGDTLFYSSNYPELIYPVGYPYVATITNSSYFSSKVFDSKTFGVGNKITLTSSTGNPLRFYGTGTLSSDTIKQNYTVIDQATGKILDFTTSGNTVVVTSGKDSVEFTSATYAGKTVDIITNVSVSDGDGTSYVLKAKNLVEGNTITATGTGGTAVSTSYVDLNKGQTYITGADISHVKMSLFVSDVKQLVKVVATKNTATAINDGMLTDTTYDVTNLFRLDNGQRDTYYDHASISLVAGATMPQGNILAIYDYYSHSGGDGYFSVKSYLGAGDGGVSTTPENYADIPQYTAVNGFNYKLADCIDFRPTRKNAQVTFEIDKTVNTDSGMLIPQNLTAYTSDYSYYLGRKDKLILSKDRNFQIIEGSPSTKPIAPDEPDGSMVIANITHDPYTALIPGEETSLGKSISTKPNLSIDKIIYKRWIKKDITDLQTRINNLEYYQALNLLEQKAASLQVPDVNGLNRFKNGIVVDDFSSYLTADTYNRDYFANINIRTKQLSSVQIVDNYQLQNPIVLKSLGTLKTTGTANIFNINGTQTNLFTLPISSYANTITQPLATSTISLNPFSVSVTQGLIKLSPPIDNWVETRVSPTIISTDERLQLQQEQQGINLTNIGDFNSLVDKTTDESVNILPYIRAQQLVFKAKGLLINTPLSCWFDGVNVDGFVEAPNTIELTGVTGTFKEDDIIGFYVSASSKFYPTGRVISVYKYPDSTNVRLYVASVAGIPSYISSQTIQNAKFDSSGNYIASSATATGTLNNSVTSYAMTGTVTGVGGSYTPVGGSGTYQIYKVSNPNDWGSFLNQYGVWNSANTYSATAYSGSFTINAPTTGTYTILASATTSSTSLSIDSVSLGTISGATTTSTFTKSLSAGSHTLSWNISGNATLPLNAVAVVVKDSNGNMIFESTNPPNLTYDSVTGEYSQSGGGSWFKGVTKIKLDQQASTANSYYVGASIKVTSKYFVEQTLTTASYYPPPVPTSTSYPITLMNFKKPTLWQGTTWMWGFHGGGGF